VDAALKSVNDRKLRTNIQYSLFNILGGAECVECGFLDKRALQFDHVRDNGAEDRRRFKSYGGMMKYYVINEVEAKQNLQVLCANCNWIKRSEDYGRRY
jgi:hypothetical protein